MGKRGRGTFGIRGRIFAVTVAVATAAIVSMVVIVPGRLVRVLDDVDVAHVRSQAAQLEFIARAEFERLETAAVDWGAWDETLAFVTGRQPEYVARNLALDELQALRVDAVAIVTSDGTMPTLLADDDDRLAPASPDFADIAAQVLALGLDAPGAATSGIAIADDEPWVIGAAAIADSGAREPPLGVIVWGRRADDQLLTAWSAGLATAPVLTVGPPPAEPEVVGDQLRWGVALPTLVGEPRTLSFVERRGADAMGGAAVVATRWLLVLSGVLAAGLFAAWLDRYLVRRLTRLEQEVAGIGLGLEGRVTVRGDDELSDLAATVNDLLERLRTGREELAQRNDELEQANHVRDEFVSTLSHEFRTPLTAILGFSDTLSTRWDAFDEATRREMVERVRAQARTLSGLVADLLALRQLQDPTAQKVVHAEATPIDQAIAEVVDGLPMPLAEQVRLDLRADGRCVPVSPEGLRRLATNLLGNADKYGRAPFEVATTVADEVVELVVSDHGQGVPTSFVDHLFEPFSQADHPHALDGSRGVGLGLSIVRAVVESAQGEIRYAPGPDGGARFVVRLPVVPATDGDQPDGDQPDADQPNGGA